MFDTLTQGAHDHSVRTGVETQRTESETKFSLDLLPRIFEQQAARRPEAIAVECGGEQLTYGELDRRANQLAQNLREAGMGAGDCVGLWLPRSLDVYVGLLGILKSGAAYVPLDPEYPADRVRFILEDCRAAALVTTTVLSAKAGAFVGQLICLDKELNSGSTQRGIAAAALGVDNITPAQPVALPSGVSAVSGDRGASSPFLGARRSAQPGDLAYIIYTSGTTGRPKGVQIEHRSVCHLVEAEAKIFQVHPQDRVYQGFSIAFDASVEEVWLAFCAGATLVAGTYEMVHAGPGLSRLLTDAGVTVLSCVPTLLSMMEEDVPSVRLLILGGETCPPDLVRRWWKPGRRVVNTYGPTEATVIATYVECHPEKLVTIGRPLPNYSITILDDELRPVTNGRPGELCIGGVGLARGYVGRPELNREKFVTLSLSGKPTERFYRTGDLARWTREGELEFLGRLDAQVKIRGFRVELSEIEAVLMESSQVLAAAVALREDTPGVQQLVAYLVARDNKPIDAEALRTSLRERLPAYMVPAVFEGLSTLPLMPSGKVDRKALPAPKVVASSIRQEIKPPTTPTQQQLASLWQKLFAPMPVSISDDFFLDLGGHSLLAARMVSELRKTAQFQQLSMLDVYQNPSIESLAGKFERLAKVAPSMQSSAGESSAHVPFWRHFWCGTAQMLSLFFILSFFALQWLTPYLTYTVLVEEEYDFIGAVLGAFASLIILYPVMLAVPILVKWVVIGRYKPGAYPLWGAYYFRWWLATTIEAAVPVSYLAGTPLLNIYMRLMGARIGRNVHLNSDSFAIYDLVSIGDDSSINVDSNLLGYTVEDGWLKLGAITIGRRCFVGARAAVSTNAQMEDDSALEDLSLLGRGQIIPRGETWVGSPAQKMAENDSRARRSIGPAESEVSRRDAINLDPQPTETRRSQPTASTGRRLAFGVLHGVGLLIFPILVVAALFPGIILMNHLNYIDPYYWYLFLSPLVGFSFILLLALEIAAIKWLLLGKVKPGQFPLHSFYYLRKWFVSQTMDLSLDVLGPLYASVYLTPWYKLLGAKLGKGAEISTASFISPDLLAIGEESFIADSVSLGAPRVRNGLMTIGPNRIGKRSFIGNSAMLPPGTVIGDKVLIGCLSAPPPNPADAVREDSTWLGSPAVFLPQRQKTAPFGEERTYDPPAKLRVMRAAIEFVRVISPSTCFIILLSLLFSVLLLIHDQYSLVETLLFFPFLYIACGVAATLFTIAAKWVLVWRYRPGEKPLWSTFVWRNELLNALHEHLAEPFLVGALTGTPFVCWYFRLLGARIGRRVYMETTDFSEFDLAEIGAQAALNADCTIQTHLFEDRVMKIDYVRIEPHSRVGAGSLVLYDTRMEEGSSLGDLSLLMKGEVLPPRTHWEGIPARSSGEGG